MADEALVESLVLESVKFVEELDAQGDPPSNALWHYSSDAEEWRLLVAGPTFDGLLPHDIRQAYQKIGTAIRRAALSSLTIAGVKPIRTDDALLIATRLVVSTPPGRVVRAHYRNNTFSGIYVKEMLVLRAA